MHSCHHNFCLFDGVGVTLARWQSRKPQSFPQRHRLNYNTQIDSVVRNLENISEAPAPQASMKQAPPTPVGEAVAPTGHSPSPTLGVAQLGINSHSWPLHGEGNTRLKYFEGAAQGDGFCLAWNFLSTDRKWYQVGSCWEQRQRFGLTALTHYSSSPWVTEEQQEESPAPSFSLGRKRGGMWLKCSGFSGERRKD